MQRSIEKFNEAVDKTTTITMRKFFEEGGYKDMEEAEFKMFVTVMELIDATIELTTKQASMIDEINTKLNLLLEK